MINGILYRAGALVKSAWKSVRHFFTKLGWKWGTALVVGVFLVLFIGSKMLGGSAAAPVADNTTKTVTLASVGDLAQGGSSLSVAGTVQSQTEATVRAESSGQVKALYRALGDTVSAGTIVAELENASQRAAVLQAQGAVDAATAGANVSQTSLAATKDASVATLLAAYGTLEKVVHTDIDAMFSDPHGNQPSFNVQSANSQAKLNTENMRIALNTVLSRESSRSNTLSASDDLITEFSKTESELKMVRDYIDSVLITLNSGIATGGVTETTIATYKATATTARGSITTTLSTLIAARQALDTAQKSSAQGTGAVSSTQAALTQAQGALAGARAALEKTIIRAPISGTINSLTLKRGDFVQMTAPVLTVANNGALEVISYITQGDATRIAVGDKAALDGSEGTITRIAPALDPITKKIEVRIGLPAAASKTLINGQSVVVTFKKAVGVPTKPTTGPITIPLSALKINSDSVVVFSVDENKKLVPHEIKLGNLLGDRVEVASGLTSDLIIVTDARGLQPGETVEVAQ